MDIATWELFLVVGSLVLVTLAVVVSIWAFVRAIRAGQIGWVIAIAVAFLFGLSWLVAIVYLLLGRRYERSRPL